MRSLSVSAFDRPVPPVMITKQPAPIKKKAKGVRNRTRRKPLPAWVRPASIAMSLALLVSGACGAVWWAYDSGYVARAVRAADAGVAETTHALGLTVRQITVSGRTRTPVAELLAAVGVRRGDSLMAFDPEDARRRIQDLPWVEAVSVRRSIPDLIHIDLTERVPFARWQNGGKTHVIDRNGVVVAETAAHTFDELPKVVGEGAAEQARHILSILRSEAVLVRRVQSATLVRERRWDVQMDNGVNVRLPEHNALAAWRQFAALEKNYAILARDLMVVDLRMPDRLIVRLSSDAARLRREPGRDT